MWVLKRNLKHMDKCHAICGLACIKLTYVKLFPHLFLHQRREIILILSELCSCFDKSHILLFFTLFQMLKKQLTRPLDCQQSNSPRLAAVKASYLPASSLVKSKTKSSLRWRCTNRTCTTTYLSDLECVLKSDE